MNRTIHQLDELGELKDLDEFAVYDTDSGYTKRYSADGLNIPVGTYFLYEGTTAPNDHYFICDGTDTTGTEKELAIVYPKLYAKLGNSNVLPDLRGRVPTNANYSTDEIKTGATWIDGKPIYRKAGYIAGVVGNTQVLDATLTTSYVDNVIDGGGACKVYNADRIIFGLSYSGDNYRLCADITSNGLCKMDSTDTYTNLSWWIEYTKANDSAETSTMNFIIRAD